ncbi:hypothetical protein GE21DRAFT_9103 [Neurospora crassa]|uniref:PH domain-containing protein n=1 Tax=Neurospora crassa (strain ATCC 24698 / 74-OR23-1A / CBS 708.71 / DSM 1257 / FGSC 987) TaxID=367110 RepID=Q7RZE1_NEUCR|nr:PH domain-containing protein [Neurospora crassa OR74A]EAA28289.1 PH domain-containing protein [Neurospora crassa OR74A]KHE78980.1 hypothetical protein GE21DRAFT_9103 [Neurospora crassa]|eukprot:XP_957525.1 PH domain-containing protein [Neurospora crassa OR74A]
MSANASAAPSRQTTMMSNASDDTAIPEFDPNSTAGILVQRLRAWKHAVAYLEDYVEAVEKIHHSQAKEYEKVLKTISHPLREGDHFSQHATNVTGVAAMFEVLRANTQGMINSNLETQKKLKETVLHDLKGLHHEIKDYSKRLSHSLNKGAKAVEKSRNTTQKHIELLSQHVASFPTSGADLNPADDPYVLRQGVIYRLHNQIQDENNHRTELITAQAQFMEFEVKVVKSIQKAMEDLNTLAGGHAEHVRGLYAQVLQTSQNIPPDFEWQEFRVRSADVLVNENEPPRELGHLLPLVPNADNPSTKALIEGSLDRKSRNKLSWGYNTGYYVVTPARYLHEFKDNDPKRKDPQPELSIYLPDAIIGAPKDDKFNVKGKDKSKGIGSKLAGTSELQFKAHSAAEAQKWFDIISNVAGALGPGVATPVTTPTPDTEDKKLEAATNNLTLNEAQTLPPSPHETGVVASPINISPVDSKAAGTAAPPAVSPAAAVPEKGALPK